MLGLSVTDFIPVSESMISSAGVLAGYETESALGIVEGISERSFPAVGVGGIGIYKGGGLDEMVEEAKGQLARLAGERGANAIVGFRYVVMGREVEKSVLAYGTAVKCRRAEETRGTR